MRSGLFTLSVSTSRYGTSLVRSGRMLYAQPISHSTSAVIANGFEIRSPMPTPTSIITIHCTYASGMLTSPRAAGRFRFVGCSRSNGASSTSLIT